MNIRLAEKNGTRRGQPRRNFAVFFWNPIRENLRTSRRADSARLEIIFQRNGNAKKKAVQIRRTPSPGMDKFALSQAGLFSSAIRKHGQKSIHGRVQLLDAR